MSTNWPLVGRDDEVNRLFRLLSRSASAGAFIIGSQGVGKTRLAQEAQAIADRAGMVSFRVTATRASAEVPLGAVAALLPPTHHGEVGAVDDRADLLRSAASALISHARGRRLVLVVDDAQWLDNVSATLIYQMAASRDALVVVTIRSDEPIPDPLQVLWKDELVERMEIGGLSAADLKELLGTVLGGVVDGGSVARLAVRSEGNVLFLRELVLGAIQDGTLRQDEGIWRLVGPLLPSRRLTELVEARLAVLEPHERSLLEIVSFGEPVGPAVLDAVEGREAAESLERKGMLIGRSDGRRLEIRLAHPVYGDVLRSQLPQLRGRAIARTLAEAVEATGARRRQDTLQVATWRLQAGGGSPELMLAAATIARWRYDFALAEKLARAAVEAGAGFAGSLLAAQLASLQGRRDEAETELSALAAEAEGDAQKGLLAVTRLDNYAFHWGRVVESLRVAEDAEANITDRSWLDEIAARRSGVLLGIHGPRAGAEAVGPLAQNAQGPAHVWACLIANLSRSRLGEFDAALAASETGYDAQLKLTQPLDWYPWLHLVFRCQTLAHAGGISEAETLAYEQYSQSVSDGSPEAQAHFAWQLSQILLQRGRVRTSVRYGREAVALFRQLGRPQLVALGLPYLAIGLAMSGQASEAKKVVGALNRLEIPTTYYLGVDTLVARAWIAWVTGDPSAACRLLEEAAGIGKQVGDRLGAAAALHSLARLGRAREVTSELTALSREIEGELAPARAAHVAALVGADAEGLVDASKTFEAIGADLLAAEAAADAMVAWRRSGSRRRATAAERRAGLLADRCEDARTPALQTIEARVRLTPADLETARLAALGRSNKDIADELQLSVRTVETRLYRLYAKVGVSNRQELETLFHEGAGADQRP